MEANDTSQASLDEARQLVDQLPPGFPRNDEAAIDAVMLLSHHHQQQHPPPPPAAAVHASEHVQDDERHFLEDPKEGKKRRADNTQGNGELPIKMQRESGPESNETDAHQQSWATFTGSNNEFEHLLHQSEVHGGEDEGGKLQQEEEQQQQQDHSHIQHQREPSQDVGDASLDGGVLSRHGRPLSTTKRAAQNRAAQRAFRERRDQHVKEVEAKAKQVDEALASAELHRQRYEELLRTIASLRAENQNLRMAINALGGHVPESAFPDANGQGNEYAMTAFDENKHDEYQTQEEKGDTQNHDSQLEGLSAVAAAAAAAAAAAVIQNGDNKEAQQGDEEGQK